MRAFPPPASNSAFTRTNIRVQRSAMVSAENSMSLDTFSMSLEAVVVNRDRGLVEAFVAVARPRDQAGGISTESIVMLVLV